MKMDWIESLEQLLRTSETESTGSEKEARLDEALVKQRRLERASQYKRGIVWRKRNQHFRHFTGLACA